MSMDKLKGTKTLNFHVFDSSPTAQNDICMLTALTPAGRPSAHSVKSNCFVSESLSIDL